MSRLSLPIAILALAVAAAAQDTDTIKRILADYETIEKSHEDWPQLSFSAAGFGEGGGTIYRVARSDETPSLMRVEIQRLDDHGPVETVCYFRDDVLQYVSHRVENTPMREKAPTTVVLRRYYFDHGKLIRAIEKQGTFPAGQEPAMDKIENTVLALSAVEGADALGEQFSAEALEAVNRLTRIVSDEPAASGAAQASGHRTGDGWRLISGSESPVHQELGIGWHVKGDVPLEKAEDGSTFYDPAGGAEVENVVVDLLSGKIIGKTHGQHGSDRARCSQAEMTNEVVWAGSREFMVQLANAKRSDTMFAELYHLPEMSRVSAGTDVLETAKSAVRSKLGKPVAADDLVLGLHDVQLAQRGSTLVLNVGANAMLPNGNGPDFAISFKVTPSNKGGAPKLTLKSIEACE